MNTATTLSEFMRMAGGWGLAAIFAVVILAMAKYIVKLVDLKEKLVKELNDKLFSLMEKKVEMDVRLVQAFDKLSERVEKFSDRLLTSEEVLR
jgi:hypothetical protein